MKYAENNRISHRQLYRQLILSFLAPFLLCIPGEMKIQGLSGAAGIVAASVLLLLYIFFLLRTSHYYMNPVKSMGRITGMVLGIFYLLYLVMTAVYLLELIEQIAPVWIVSGISVKWLSFLAVLVCAYGADRGMQRRGRIADVSGGVFLTIIVIMLLLCIGQGKMEYLNEMFQESQLQGRKIVQNTYGFLCAFSGISLLPFVLPEVEKRGSAGKTITMAILTVGGVSLAILFILPAVLGWKRVAGYEAYPILPLMAGADLPGNVLARFDVLWMSFLLYGIFFAIGSCFHYGIRILDTMYLKSGKFWIPVVVYLLSMVQINGRTLAYFYKMYLENIFVPGVILIQIYLLLRGQQKRRKKMVSAMSFLLVMILGCTGCAGTEPEKRMYPLAVGADFGDGEYVITYGMPDLPKATGQGKEEEAADMALTIKGENFDKIRELYERSQEKYLDIGHLQILVLGRKLIESERWSTFLEYLKEEPLAGENIYVFQADDPKQLLNAENGGTSFGEYVTGIIENQTERSREQGVTLRQVYHQWYQNGTLKKLPLITLENDEIQIWLE